MPLVAAKCTNCGANLEVDNSKDAAICPYCGTAYIVEKAITKYQLEVKTVNIYNSTSESEAVTVEALIQRMKMLLEDSKWDEADKYCDRILDIEPENSNAYIGKLMVACRAKQFDDLKDSEIPLNGTSEYSRALQYIPDSQKNKLMEYAAIAQNRYDEKRKKDEREKNNRIYLEARNFNLGCGIEALVLAIVNIVIIIAVILSLQTNSNRDGDAAVLVIAFFFALIGVIFTIIIFAKMRKLKEKNDEQNCSK